MNCRIQPFNNAGRLVSSQSPLGSPHSADIGRTQCGGGVPEGRTRTALCFVVSVQQGSLLFGGHDSLWRSLWFHGKFFMVGFSPRLGYSASIIEEFPYDNEVVSLDTFGHPHPVNPDIRREVFIF